MNIRLIVLFAAMLWETCCVHAQLEDVSISPLSHSGSQPLNEVTQVFQDSHGYVWYGTTNGLCRDDGYAIHVFRKNVFRPDALDVNEVTVIAEDGSDHLWVATSAGLIRMNPGTFEMERVGDDELMNTRVEFMLASADGSIWAMGTRHLYHISAEGRILRMYDTGPIFCLYEDGYGRLWVSRYGMGLQVLDVATGRFDTKVEGIEVSAMIHDRANGCYWLCDRNDGFMKYVEGHDGTPPVVERQPDVMDDYGHRITLYTHLVQDDRYGYIWAIAYYRGLYVFRPSAEGHLQRLSTAGMLPQNNYIYNSIDKRGDGRLWVTGFDSQSFVIDLDGNRIKYDTLPTLAHLTHFAPSVMALCRDGGGVYWVMQKRNNLWLYDAATDSWTDYMKLPQVNKLPLYLTQHLIPSHTHTQRVWAVYSYEAILLERQGMNLTMIKRVSTGVEQDERAGITTAYEDTGCNLWMGTRHGLYMMPHDSSLPRHIGTTDGEIADMAEDRQHNIWCAVRGQGLLKVTPGGESHLYPLGIDIITVTTAAPSLWIGTRAGRVYRFDESQDEGKRYSDFTEDCGMNGESIEHLDTDCFNHLWIMTSQGVKEYNPANGAFRTTTTATPSCPLLRLLPSSVFIDPTDSLIYIGGIPGFMTLSPSKKLESKPTRVIPHITDVSVAGASVWFDPKNHARPGEITLGHNAHNITISFSSLDFANLQNIRYAYKMDGVDDDWTELDAGHNTAIYNRLPRGRHTLHIKSTDTNGLWSDAETRLYVYRQPAWYETILAYIIYTLIAIAAATTVIMLYKRHLEKQNQKKLADNITQAKMTYFTSISHELLTPLTIINLLAGRLKPQQDSDEPRLIQANVMRLKRLLQQVLDFRKVESNNMKLYVEHTNITEMLRTICRESFEPLAVDSNIQFMTLLPVHDIEGYVDRDKIEKIMFNLVSNAMKYTPTGRKVTLSATEQANILTLSVSDEGIGIEPKEQKYIFNRFYSSRKNAGTISNGIGLSLTKELVTLHHGTISLESQPRKGSTFKVELPIDAQSYDETELGEPQIDTTNIATSKTAQHTDTPNIPSHTTSLLMVEDNLELLAAMQDMLSTHYTVFCAHDGIEALDIIENEDISIVVSDISMPRMDGIQLCNTIKNDIRFSHTIIVLLTAMTGVQTQVESYKAGADAYLPKPFDTPVLLSLLESLMAGRAKMQQHFQHTAAQTSADEMEVGDIDRQFVQHAINIVEQHISESEYDVEALCSDMMMSRSTLTRKLKALTGQTPSQFIRSIRLRYAYQLLQNQTIGVAEAMYRVGYNDQRSFTLAFKDMFGITPGAVH